ncbi:MAG TPA: N-6 DNA methylase [Mycobacteriales bacterium]|nr:N-6 DNA methylase [Mycobacteriales bacterium]
MTQLSPLHAFARPTRRTAPPAGDPYRHAHRIAAAVDDAWHRAHGTGDLPIPVSTVAALALLAPADDGHDDLAEQLLALDVDQFTALMRTQWSIFAHNRPDLLVPAAPLVAAWHGEHALDARATDQARRVAHAALRAGLLQLTGTGQRIRVDLFGALLTALRSRTDRSVRGQFYTPGDLSNLIAAMLGTPQAGQTVHEPAAGTGGMLRAVAQTMREHGTDPATVAWVAVDTDPLAIACLSVNTVLWGLGHRVLLAVGDCLTDDPIPRAAAQRDHTLRLVRLAGQLQAIRTLLADEPPTANGSPE